MDPLLFDGDLWNILNKEYLVNVLFCSTTINNIAPRIQSIIMKKWWCLLVDIIATWIYVYCYDFVFISDQYRAYYSQDDFPIMAILNYLLRCWCIRRLLPSKIVLLAPLCVALLLCMIVCSLYNAATLCSASTVFPYPSTPNLYFVWMNI